MTMHGAFDHTHKLIIKTLLLLLITTTTIIIVAVVVVVVVVVVIIIYSRFSLSFELLLILRTNLLRCHCSEALPKKTT